VFETRCKGKLLPPKQKPPQRYLNKVEVCSYNGLGNRCGSVGSRMGPLRSCKPLPELTCGLANIIEPLSYGHGRAAGSDAYTWSRL
jgi:hypothetical protein